MPRKGLTRGRTSSLYISKSTIFKVFLLAGIVLISAIFIWYTFSVIDRLQEDARDQVNIYVKLWQLAANSPTTGGELQFIFNEIIVKASFPIIVVDEDGNPLYWRNIPSIDPSDTTAASRERLKRIAQNMYGANQEYPLYYAETYVHYLCYGDSEVINQLKLMPFIEIGIVLAIMIVGLIGFQNIRRSEERHIWVGMAKETAHQLGTPISSLMGWLEVVGAEFPDELISPKGKVVFGNAVENMTIDVQRLQRVANRFGQIGSVPELKSCNINALTAEVVEYYRRRLPFEGKGIQIVFVPTVEREVELNAELFTWGLENMVKNALQAVDSKAGRVTISTELDSDGRSVQLAIQDNGKGISAAAARKIFRPGFTTKKRGWGLGLTLVKRIIEDYHGGQIWLEKSQPGETVFVMQLPLSGQGKG